MQVNIIYFASLRDASQKSNERYTTESESIDSLFDELHEKYNFSLSKKDLRVALNEEYVDFSSKFNNGDTIVFIPPVAGG